MNKIEKKADVVIIGGGVNGCSLAYQLAKKNKKVVLLEKSYLCSGATGRCGAGIRQQWSTKENAELAIKSVKIFERLEKELGAEIGLRQGGYLIAVHDKKNMKQAEKNVLMQKNLGLNVSILSPEEILKIVPILDIKGMKAIGATFCPTDGHVDPFKTTHAYAKAAEKNGAKLYKFTSVTDIKTKNKSVESVITSKGTIKTKTVVNAAGAWSKQISDIVGIKLPNKPFRKEILVTERVKPMFKTMVISFKDGIYFSQQDEGQILGGIPIPNERSGYLTSPTLDFIHHMSKTLTRYTPILKHVNVIRQWTGYYDVTPDARPILGETDKLKGFIQCNGFSGHGFMLSPMVTKILTEYIVDGKYPKILESLNLDRFKDKTTVKEVSVVG
jgi:sarcosine oxidase subunit beta